MKKSLVTGLILVVIVLDLLALDDITTGNEPNYWGEFGMLLISLVIFIAFGIAPFQKKQRIK